MGEYFKGWRRKFGVVTLLMALVFMAGWVRSQYIFDNFDINLDEHSYMTFSSNILGVGCNRSHFRTLTIPANLRSPRYWTATANHLEATDDEENEISPYRFAIWSFQPDGDPESDPQHKVVIIRYFVIVIPLTMLSAFLLLTKPRKSNQKKTTEPVPVEGA